MEAAIRNPPRERLNHENAILKQNNYSLYLFVKYNEKVETATRAYYRFYFADKENKAKEIFGLPKVTR